MVCPRCKLQDSLFVCAVLQAARLGCAGLPSAEVGHHCYSAFGVFALLPFEVIDTTRIALTVIGSLLVSGYLFVFVGILTLVVMVAPFLVTLLVFVGFLVAWLCAGVGAPGAARGSSPWSRCIFCRCSPAWSRSCSCLPLSSTSSSLPGGGGPPTNPFCRALVPNLILRVCFVFVVPFSGGPVWRRPLRHVRCGDRLPLHSPLLVLSGLALFLILVLATVRAVGDRLTTPHTIYAGMAWAMLMEMGFFVRPRPFPDPRACHCQGGGGPPNNPHIILRLALLRRGWPHARSPSQPPTRQRRSLKAARLSASAAAPLLLLLAAWCLVARSAASAAAALPRCCLPVI